MAIKKEKEIKCAVNYKKMKCDRIAKELFHMNSSAIFGGHGIYLEAIDKETFIKIVSNIIYKHNNED